MDSKEFRKQAHKAVDWVADYLENIEKYPVKSQVKPKEVYDQIPTSPPAAGEPFDQLMKDLDEKIIPGITHWQHPHYHAYFPANNSYPSIIAEILTAGIGAQCMVWETSPAAAELEERMMEWLKEIMELPKNWHGVIQDTASTASLVAILTARERVTNFRINEEGFKSDKLRIYCSSETHSSVEKGAKIAGFGRENVVKIPVDSAKAMIPEALEQQINQDIANGYQPCCVVSALGTTGTLAFDPTKAIGEICQKHHLWLHIDAAYAGCAMILPELSWLKEGLDLADSFVFNPHKWLFTNFDCTAYYVKDKEVLIKTFEILPEYLKTKTRGRVNDYRDWGVQLGRRFRALKLWFVMRTFGVDKMREVLRNHLKFGEWIAKQIEANHSFEHITPPQLNMVVFRYIKEEVNNEELNELNQKLLEDINASGKAFLTHTKVDGKYAIRLVLGNTYLEERHVKTVWDLITSQLNNI